MKIHKLDATGFTHAVLLMGFFVLFATAGVGLLVATHADSLTTAKPKGRCTIKGVTHNPKAGQTLKPIVIITNTGKKAFTPQLATSFTLGTASQPQKAGGSTASLPMLQPKKQAQLELNPFSVQYRTTNYAIVGTYKLTSQTPKFSCSSKFVLPKAKVYNPPV